jgi:ArsR family transcriptional regulator
MENVYFFKALSSPTRLKIVKALLKKEHCACDIPPIVGKAQPTVSLELKKLVNYGILERHKEGTRCIYRVAGGRVKFLLDTILSDKA